ncbi:MAG: methylenetetrahydrofolate reductase [Varibaculum sp.]|nr:methylenetetrahydrofolate reductase [Varibaculum sp.]
MTIAALYRDYRPTLRPFANPTVSFELFPPRAKSERSSIWVGVDRLINSDADFVSVTYGAAGSEREKTLQLLHRINAGGPEGTPIVPVIGHLTCVGATRTELTELVRALLRAGVRNFLALRGDPPAGQTTWDPPADAVPGSVALVRLIRQVAAEILPDGVGNRENGSGPAGARNPADYVSVAVAGYPGASGTARSGDIEALAEKQQAGADFVLTQVFYDVNDYISIVRRAARAGVTMPIVPGIIPLTDLKRLSKLEKLSGVPVPLAIREVLSDPDASVRLSLAMKMTMDLATGCLTAGAPGIHIYTFNRPRPAIDLLEYIRVGGYLGGSHSGLESLGGGSHGVARGVDLELMDLALHRMTPGR